jgi:hypothetical protein
LSKRQGILVEKSNRTAGNIFTSQLCLIDNAGHEINMTASKKLADAMNCFYKRTTA